MSKEIEEISEDDLIELWYVIGGTPHLFEYGKEDLKTVLITGETCNDDGDNFGLSLGYYTMAAIVDKLRERGFAAPVDAPQPARTYSEQDALIERKDLFDKYVELEEKITTKILDVGDSELMDMWLDWQEKRNILNTDWLKTLESLSLK